MNAADCMSSQLSTSKGETSAFSAKQIHGLKIFSASLLELNSCVTHFLRACLHGGGGPQVGEVTRLGGVTRLSI